VCVCVCVCVCVHERETERQRDRERDRDRDRETERHRDTERDRDTEQPIFWGQKVGVSTPKYVDKRRIKKKPYEEYHPLVPEHLGYLRARGQAGARSLRVKDQTLARAGSRV